MKKIFRPLLIFACIAIIISIITTWIGLLFGSWIGYPYANYIFPGSKISTGLSVVNIYFLIAIPLGFLVIFFMKMVNKYSVSKGIKRKMWLFWAINLISFVFFSGKMFKEFNYEGTESEIISQELDIDNLHIKSIKTDYDNIMISIGNLKVVDDYLWSDKIRLEISKADQDKFEIWQKKTARGNSRKYAKSLARSIENDAQLKDTVLVFSDIIKIHEGQKWRNQEVMIEIKVPAGKHIEFDNNPKWFSMNTDDATIDGADLEGKKFQMTENGLHCLNCKTETEKE